MHISKLACRSILTLAVALFIGGKVLAVGTNSVPYVEPFTGDQDDPIVSVDGWSAGEDDTSTIINVDYSVAAETKGYPITNYDHSVDNMVLNLNTGASVLTNSLDGADFSEDKLYIDTMVKFVLSENNPEAITNDLGVKAAFFANADSNLVVYCGSYNSDEEVLTFSDVQFLATDGVVDVDKWSRLTVVLDNFDNQGDEMNAICVQAFKVFLNGVAVTSANAYSDNWKNEVLAGVPAGGSWFLSAANRKNDTGAEPDKAEVTALAFQGTGLLDDLVVSFDEPVFTAPSFFTITQVIGANGSADPAALTVQIEAGGSTQIVYTADQWFRIEKLSVDDVEVVAAAGEVTYQWNVANVQADISNEVSFVAASGAEVGLPAGVDPVWASGYYATEAEALADANLATDYLLNLDPTEDYDIALTINTIALDNGDVANAVVLTDDGNEIDVTINGVLKLQGKEDLLDGEWNDLGGNATVPQAEFELGTNVVTDVAVDDYRFFRAVIVPQN